MRNTKGNRGWAALIVAAISIMLAAATAAPAQTYTVGCSVSLGAQSFKVLHNFAGAPDGNEPYGGLVQDAADDVYGTTELGGAFFDGAVFKIDAKGNETVLHSFNGVPDGRYPVAGLLLDSAGNLYGTTSFGGASDLGTVFKLDKTGAETILYSFAGVPDGIEPQSGLVRDPAGNFYGTTEYGGAFNFGTVFKLDPTNKATVLYSFTGAAGDGEYPIAGLVLDGAGNLYGTANQGGDLSCQNAGHFPGCGIVFKLDQAGKETILHTFTGGADGSTPGAGYLLRDPMGNLYGTATLGGTSSQGVVFKLDREGAESVLHTFTGYPTDGSYPIGSLAMDAEGNLYGTASQGGLYNSGIVFALDENGREGVLHSFDFVDGNLPFGGLLRDPGGNLYGTTYEGGSYEGGTVFVAHTLTDRAQIEGCSFLATMGGDDSALDVVATPNPSVP